jgi:hypothetical protein
MPQPCQKGIGTNATNYTGLGGMQGTGLARSQAKTRVRSLKSRSDTLSCRQVSEPIRSSSEAADVELDQQYAGNSPATSSGDGTQNGEILAQVG